MKPLGRWMSALSLVAPIAAPAASVAHADVAALAARGVALARTVDDWPRSSLLVGVAGGTVQTPLREVRLWIDGEERARQQYNLDEGKALARGALHLLSFDDLAPGRHRLHAEAFAVDPLAPPYAPRSAAKLDLQIDRPVDGAVALEFSLRGADLLHAPALTARPLAASDAERSRCARFLLADGRVFEAAALAAGESGTDEEALDPAIQRYGEAITLLREDPPAGVDRLRQLAEDERVDPWLRDRASIVRGEQLLIAHRNAEAAQAFRAVRSPGPFANRALLELGWSALLPTADDPGRSIRPASYALPASADAVAQLRRRTPFRNLNALATEARAEDIRTALIPWMELVGRDPFDPAVQDGLLAVPYALQHLGAQAQAVEYAQRAIAQLEAAHALLVQAQTRADELPALAGAHLDDDRNGWHQQAAALATTRRWWLGDAVEPGYYAGVLLEDAAFVAELEDYRTLHRLLRFLDRHPELPGVSGLRGEAASALASVGAELTSSARTLIAERARITADDLAEAHLWLARLHDRAAQQVSSR